MDSLASVIAASDSLPDFAVGYFNYLHQLLSSLDRLAISHFVAEIEMARELDQTVFIIGNGGSAATASHISNDLSVGVTAAGRTGKPFRVLSLTDNAAALTAIGNDFGYDDIFSAQLSVHFRQGDRLVVISASGNSPNLIKAADWVKQRGGRVLGLLGFDGGKLAPLCDVAIVAKTPKGEYGPVEDVHMILDHLIYSWLKHKGT